MKKIRIQKVHKSDNPTSKNKKSRAIVSIRLTLKPFRKTFKDLARYDRGENIKSR